MVEAMAYRVTCLVCGVYKIVSPERFGDEHINMRTHVRTVHSKAVYNLLGQEVSKGYGWTDNQVAVMPLVTKEDIQVASSLTEDLLMAKVRLKDEEGG